jgi:hypothetical protein
MQRAVYHGFERVLHTILAINFGALLLALAPMLIH